MLKKKIQNLLIKLGLTICITISLFNIGAKLGSNSKVAYANSNTYSVSQSINQQEIKDTIKQIQSERKVSKGKILIYSSHSCEKNVDSTILQISEDLSKKLTSKGFQVEHEKTLFANEQGYNRSYHSSARMLDGKDLSQYILVIDIHMNSGVKPLIVKDINNNDVAQIEMVQTKTNPNLQAENKIAEGITKEINKFGYISRGIYSIYQKGINWYNLSKSPNMLLIEMGNNLNNEISVKRASTYLSSAINTYFESLTK